MPNKNEVLRQYSSDLLSLDKQILSIVKDQANIEEAQRYPEVQQLIRTTHERVASISAELEQNLSSLGGESSSMLKQAMGKVGGVVTGIAGKAESSEKASKVLRNTYAALDAATLGSMMLHTTALAFDEKPTADVADRHVRELAPLAVQVRDMILDVVVKEFADEGYAVNTDAVGEVKSKAQQAWTQGRTT
jgi:ferritin-like metal-binding protein YciE